MMQRGQPPKAIIVIPTEPVRKAGAHELIFDSVLDAAKYFGMLPQSISRILVNGDAARPSCGFFFDYKI